jgi:hypothetical protein
MEALRRWEEIRIKNKLTPQQKQILRDPEQEHHILINELNELEIVPYEQIKDAAGGDVSVRVFVFERKNRICVVYWHTSGEGRLELTLPENRTVLMEQIGKAITVQSNDGKIIVPVSKLRYLEIRGLNKRKVITAFQQAKVLPAQ